MRCAAYNTVFEIMFNKIYKGKKVFITGGAGFIGSHLVDKLIDDGNKVTVYDNLISGKREWIEHHLGEKVFRQVLKDSVKYVEAVTLGKPITYLAPKSEQAEAFRQIGKEVLNAQNL